jgi:hypothetical protein
MKNVIVIVVCVLFISCQNKSEKNFEQLEKMNWLIGNWENKMDDGILSETWKKENDSTFSGKSYFIVNSKDTVHSETIILTQLNNQLIYSPTVKGQNDDKPIDFIMTSDSENNFVFENPKHDYPQKIVYKKATENSLVATISGMQQGKQSTESYPMKKK